MQTHVICMDNMKFLRNAKLYQLINKITYLEYFINICSSLEITRFGHLWNAPRFLSRWVIFLVRAHRSRMNAGLFSFFFVFAVCFDSIITHSIPM